MSAGIFIARAIRLPVAPLGHPVVRVNDCPSPLWVQAPPERVAGTIVDRIVDDAFRPRVTLLNVFAGIGKQRDESFRTR
jgi:hypothetical protein